MAVTPFIPLRVTRRFAAPAARVFDAWLYADGARQWLFATPTGEMVQAEIDPRVGGKWRFVDRRPEGDAVHRGTYLTIDRPRRLAFTWAVGARSPDDTRVIIELAPLGAGCELTLRHERVWADYETRTAQGWTSMLEAVARLLAARG